MLFLGLRIMEFAINSCHYIKLDDLTSFIIDIKVIIIFPSLNETSTTSHIIHGDAATYEFAEAILHV